MENVGKKKLDMQKLLAPAALVILYIVFSIFGNNFLTLDTVKNILESSYYIGFMAFGVTFIIITGGIDLSLGTVMMCAALLGGYAFKQGWPLILAIVLTLFVGIAFGFANGVLIAKLKLPPFIATLGTQMMAAGLGSIITKVQSQTWPTATAEVGGWFKKVFIRAELFGVRGFPVGAFWLLGFWRPKGLVPEKFVPLFAEHVLGDGKLVYATGSRPASLAGPVGCAKVDRRARRASKRKGAERHVNEL